MVCTQVVLCTGVEVKALLVLLCRVGTRSEGEWVALINNQVRVREGELI